MKRQTGVSHAAIRRCTLGMCLIAVVALFAAYAVHWWKDGARIQKVDINIVSEGLDIAWDVPNAYLCKGVDVTVSAGDDVVCSRQFDPHVRHMLFSDGEHGRNYTVTVTAHFKNGNEDVSQEKTALFVDAGRLPDLPLLVIDTRSGDEPTYEMAVKEDERFLGWTQTHNEYLEGELRLIGAKGERFSDRVKIRTRGNTSCVGMDKKPYKIILNDSYDLLGMDRPGAHREWALLSAGQTLNDYTCDLVSELCGVEWQRDAGFVNLVLNGDWKGCYYLTETVGIDSARGLVSDSGYIIENDPYWWNSDGLYFKTDAQDLIMGYTFKYPQINSVRDKRVAAIRQYMNEFESLLLSGNEAYRDYIDEDSFARWFLVRDITGTLDGAGSNIFYYKYDFDPKNPTSSKLKMGPLWDHDHAFRTPDAWSASRIEKLSRFSSLFAQRSFSDLYLGAWIEVRDTLYADIESRLSELLAQHGEALEESWKLDSARWGSDGVMPVQAAADALTWFADRIDWMNRELGVCDPVSVSIDVSNYAHSGGLRFYIESYGDLAGLKSIAGWAFVDGREDDESLRVCWMAEDGTAYFPVNVQEREDVKAAFGLTTNLVGFTINARQDGRICVVDTENRTIYEAD